MSADGVRWSIVNASPGVRDALQGHNALLRLLEPAWGIAKLDQPVILDRDGHLEARFFPVPGKVPTWLAKLASNQPEMTVGVRITDLRSGRRLAYAPGIAKLDAGTLGEFEAARCSFVGGTFFRNDELSALRPGAPDAAAMGHVPIAGPGGSLPALAELRGRVVYIRINDTNPILDANSPEASLVQRTRIEIAMDGMELDV